MARHSRSHAACLAELETLSAYSTSQGTRREERDRPATDRCPKGHGDARQSSTKDALLEAYARYVPRGF